MRERRHAGFWSLNIGRGFNYGKFTFSFSFCHLCWQRVTTFWQLFLCYALWTLGIAEEQGRQILHLVLLHLTKTSFHHVSSSWEEGLWWIDVVVGSDLLVISSWYYDIQPIYQSIMHLPLGEECAWWIEVSVGWYPPISFSFQCFLSAGMTKK